MFKIELRAAEHDMGETGFSALFQATNKLPDETIVMPRLVYLVSEDWYFLSHRLPMAQAAQRAGYDVHVATHVGAHGDVIEQLGFHLHKLHWRRGSVNPFNLLRTVWQVRQVYRR